MDNIDTRQISLYEFDSHTVRQILQSGRSFVLEGWLLGICNAGSFDYMLNQERRHVMPKTIFYVAPKQLFSVVDFADVLSVTLIHIPSDMLSQMQSRADMLTSFPQTYRDTLFNTLARADTLLAQDCPMPASVCGEMRQLAAVLKNHVYPQSPQANFLLAESILQAMLVLAMQTLTQRSQQLRPLSRQEQVTKSFFTSLMRHHKERHDIAFYANEMCLTPKYLSAVVRSVTGIPAQEWIARVLVISAKRMLRAKSLSVAQVADVLHFSSSSSFIRFFRSHTGLTPHEFRSSHS